MDSRPTAPFTTCAICGKPVARIEHRFKERPAPHNQPFRAALYFRDPFFGPRFEEYCGAACSTAAHTRDSKK